MKWGFGFYFCPFARHVYLCDTLVCVIDSAHVHLSGDNRELKIRASPADGRLIQESIRLCDVWAGEQLSGWVEQEPGANTSMFSTTCFFSDHISTVISPVRCNDSKVIKHKISGFQQRTYRILPFTAQALHILQASKGWFGMEGPDEDSFQAKVLSVGTLDAL